MVEADPSNIDCYHIDADDGSYYAGKFPDPNGRAVLWPDGSPGISLYSDIDTALETLSGVTMQVVSAADFRRFSLRRKVDETGFSGTGTVAVGIEFPDGYCVMGWMTGLNSIAVYDCIEDVRNIHGHGGSTQVRYESVPSMGDV
jgi:hypothetical protein